MTGEQQPNGRLCVTLSPTDLTLLYEACRRCFYGKVRLGQPPPRTPMTTLWNRLDQLEKARFVGAPASPTAAGEDFQFSGGCREA